MNLREVRKIVGEKIALIGNVNCALLQTGKEEKCDEDVLRTLWEGMADGKGYIFQLQIVYIQAFPWKDMKECGGYGSSLGNIKKWSKGKSIVNSREFMIYIKTKQSRKLNNE